MSWTGVWIGIALILGFCLGVTLMSVLAIAGQVERRDTERYPHTPGQHLSATRDSARPA